MKDAIDIRDTKRRIASSVVKWWDVKYLMDDEEDDNDSAGFGMGYGHHSQSALHNDSASASNESDNDAIQEEPEEVLEATVDDGLEGEEKKAQEMMNHMSEEDRQAALDIIERLNREAFEDDLKKSMEIEMLKAEMNNNEEG